jgi:hypothetical protein
VGSVCCPDLGLCWWVCVSVSGDDCVLSVHRSISHTMLRNALQPQQAPPWRCCSDRQAPCLRRRGHAIRCLSAVQLLLRRQSKVNSKLGLKCHVSSPQSCILLQCFKGSVVQVQCGHVHSCTHTHTHIDSLQSMHQGRRWHPLCLQCGVAVRTYVV